MSGSDRCSLRFAALWGTEALLASGRIGAELGDALKAEARRRVQAGSLFGYIAYASLIASEPE